LTFEPEIDNDNRGRLKTSTNVMTSVF